MAFPHSEHRTYNARTLCGTAFVVPDFSFAVARRLCDNRPALASRVLMLATATVRATTPTVRWLKSAHPSAP